MIRSTYLQFMYLDFSKKKITSLQSQKDYMYCNTICTQAVFFSLLGVLDFLPNDYLNGTPYVAAEYYYIHI